MSRFEPQRSDRVRRVRADIAGDEQALRVAEAQRDIREVKRLTRDLANRRAYLAELLGQRAPGPGPYPRSEA